MTPWSWWQDTKEAHVGQPTNELFQRYVEALLAYMLAGGEGALARANELGRQALMNGLGVLDMVALHHSALDQLVADKKLKHKANLSYRTAAEFLSEALSPFEITHQGFRDATETMAKVIPFAAVVCHELRTPLTSILNSAGMLQEVLNAEPASPESKLLANVITGACILRTRTDDLMDLVGFQSGTVRLKPRQVDVLLLLRGIQQQMELLVRQAGMELRIDVQENLPLVNADPERLEQALSNLVENALKYASEGKRVDLRGYVADNSLVLEVQDYGQGMSLWDRMKLYQPNLLSPRNRSEVPGLGIGLALCRQIVELHRGTFTMDSEKGKGSLLRISLPIGYSSVKG